MSVLETPRIYFRGQISWDPIVTNNYEQFYDEDSAEPVPAGTAADAFRRRAIRDVTRGNWNPHGTHRSTFFDSEVSGVDVGDGLNLADPLVGAPVSFLGMLVDCEPYGSISSQLFFDAMQFGIRGGCRIGCAGRTRMTARYINFNRNTANLMIAGVASVVWQTSFSKEDALVLDAHDSAAIGGLLMALESPDVLGLTVRWNAYRTIYYDDSCLRNGSPEAQAAAQALQRKLGPDGKSCWQPNPARSLLVGVLGLWREGEPAQEPGDRALLSLPPGEVVGSAHARLGEGELVVDFANSIPEVDTNLTKQNFGPLHLVAVNGADTTALGTINYSQYSRAAYEQTAGIVALKLSQEALAAAQEGNIQVRDGDGNSLLAEEQLRAIPAVHNLYVNEGESSSVEVLVLDRGVPAGAGIEVTMYDATRSTAPPRAVAQSVTDGNGVAIVEIGSVTTGGCRSYIFVPDGGPAPAGVDTQLTTYMYVRTLPADDDLADLEPSWPNVYSNVLANWHSIAPCMDNWLRLDDEEQVRRYAGVLRTLTDPANFESYRFMPVVRDMTKGERTLLYKFLDRAAAAPARAVGLEAAGEPVTEDATPRRAGENERIGRLAKLSRAMRSSR